jgi:hypothetical protein
MNKSRVIITGVLTMLFGAVLVGCGSDDTSTTTTSRVTTTSTASTSTSVNASATASVYFIRDEKVGPAGRPVTAGTPAQSALTALLAGPSAEDAAAGLSTLIPSGTKLLGVSIANDIATVDLSKEFTSGGGSLSMQGRVAQVVYTATQFPSAHSVNFRVDGAPLTVLGGEGVMLDKPQTRADWESFTPAILVESPLPFAKVTSPLHVTGTANTFEATFQITVTDSAGTKVYDHFATATSGTGTRGTFDETVTFSGAKPGRGTLQVWEASAKDGQPVNVVKIPIDF